jgi:hypothetical protein
LIFYFYFIFYSICVKRKLMHCRNGWRRRWRHATRTLTLTSAGSVLTWSGSATTWRAAGQSSFGSFREKLKHHSYLGYVAIQIKIDLRITLVGYMGAKNRFSYYQINNALQPSLCKKTNLSLILKI